MQLEEDNYKFGALQLGPRAYESYLAALDGISGPNIYLAIRDLDPISMGDLEVKLCEEFGRPLSRTFNDFYSGKGPILWRPIFEANYLLEDKTKINVDLVDVSRRGVFLSNGQDTPMEWNSIAVAEALEGYGEAQKGRYHSVLRVFQEAPPEVWSLATLPLYHWLS